MDEKPIKDIPSFKQLREDAKSFSAFKKGWIFIRPFAKVLGVDVKKIDKALEQVDPLVKKTDDLISLPDEFNTLYGSNGWIMYDLMNVDIVKKAIELGKSGQFDEAENTLLDFYSPEEIKRELRTMIAVKAFWSRMALAEKALIDFQERRYYSSVLVVLSLLDGMVNEIQHRGFFAKDADLTAWDSIAAHSLGLQKLASIYNQTRKKTRTDAIDLPYRHGIMHGMDLGYDNRAVVVKAWVALFATRDWALKAERNQLVAPPVKPDKTWKEIIDLVLQNDRDKKALESWKPRNRPIGEVIPYFGVPTDYEENSPERRLTEFLHYWKSSNYGYMARYIYSHSGENVRDFPRRIREDYYGKRLNSWQLMEIVDDSPAVTLIKASVMYEENSLTKTKIVQARMILHDDQNIVFVGGRPNSRWSLVSWQLNEIN